MSLTSELRKADSPISAFINGISASLTATYGNSRSSQLAAQKLGFTELIALDVLVPLTPGVDAPRSGTAFDIRTRMALGAFDLESSASAMGVDRVLDQSDSMENGAHRARVMVDLYEEAQRLLLTAPTEDDLDLASLLLSPSEQFFRANTNALTGSLGDALDAAANGQSFIEHLHPDAVADIRNLRVANAEQIVAWRKHIDAGGLFEGNPIFAGSLLIGGADGDWLVGETLVDCKVYAKLTVPKLRDFLRQLLGYVMLDLDDALKIRSVGVWLPRQTTMRIWSLESLLGGDPEALLPRLREDFVKSTRHDQIAVHVPATEHQKLQLVADNRFSPAAMLRTLAHSDDKDLRMRVGRNRGTPGDVIRMLSEDRYAAVRVGVAGNGSTPQDVVYRLTSDRSVAVRRAAAGTSGSALAVDHALTASVGPPSTELVATPLQANGPMVSTHVEIRQNRDPQEIDFELLWNMLSAMSSDGGVDERAIRLPEATRVFGWRTGRKPVGPDSLRRGLPIHVLEAMFEPERPLHLRRMAAGLLPVDDPELRGRLLADSDVEIRWRSLRRSMSCVDEPMSRFLAGLASSRDARIEFSTAGVPRHDLWQRPAEYDEDVLEAIAAHEATPQESLHELLDQKSPAVLLALAGNAALGQESFSHLVERMLLVSSTESRWMFAESRLCPAAVLEKLAQNRSAEIRTAVAGNTSSPSATLELLANDRDVAVRMAVLENRSSPASLVSGLAEQLLATLEDALLLNALRICSWRDDIQLSDELVEQALDRLSKSRVRDPDPRSFVASHERAAAATLARLAKSSDEDLRKSVAGNPRTPQDTLNILLRDDSIAVRVRAARTVEANAESDKSDEEPAAELEVSSRPTISVADLHELVASKRADVRKQAAYNPATTPDMLTFLAGDRRSVIVRRIVAANPATPPATLRALASEDDAQIIQSLAFSSGTPIDVLAELAGRSIDLALLVAFNPDAPDEILGALVHDDDPLVKFVAQEVAASRPTLAPGPGRGNQHELSAPDS